MQTIFTYPSSPRLPPQAYAHIIDQLVSSSPPSSSTTSIRLLISHNLMGTIIGRNGLKIKSIQENSGTRMTASKDMLPQSTERTVEVQGTSGQIGCAILEIGKCLLEDWERGAGTVQFQPKAQSNGEFKTRVKSSDQESPQPSNHLPETSTSDPGLRTQNISIPSDMVGCIIGRNGSKITEIRRLSGSKISIAKLPHDDTNERMFTIIGKPEANEKALFLLYNQLESEKERRVGREQQQHECQQ